MTVAELCALTHNYFERGCTPYCGKFSFPTLPEEISSGQYFHVEGSLFNDGVHRAGEDDLNPETFFGYIWPMRVPPDFIALAEKITAWDAALPSTGRYVSQSFHGWSGTLATGPDGRPIDGVSQYRADINQWRRI